MPTIQSPYFLGVMENPVTPIGGGDLGGSILAKSDRVPHKERDSGGPLLRLPNRWNLLKKLEMRELYPEPSKLWLVAWKIFTNTSGNRTFLRQSLTLPPEEESIQNILIPILPNACNFALQGF